MQDVGVRMSKFKNSHTFHKSYLNVCLLILYTFIEQL